MSQSIANMAKAIASILKLFPSTTVQEDPMFYRMLVENQQYLYNYVPPFYTFTGGKSSLVAFSLAISPWATVGQL